MTVRFDFQHYIETRKRPQSRRSDLGDFGEYAFSSDLRVLRALSRAKAVRLAVEATVRAWKAWARSDILGRSVKIGPRQFPHLYEVVAECAEKLHISVPTTYVFQDFSAINAGTYGTESDSFILIPAITVERMNREELSFVIGHECGHIQNSHVTYKTALHYLKNYTSMLIRGVSTPATVALMSWSRRAEITCDRAGLICCGDPAAAQSALVKTAVGAQALSDEINIEAYLDQLDEIREGVGRVSEYFLSHPYLPKRLRALQLFAESDYFRQQIGESGGKPLSDVDKEVEQLVSVL